MAVPPALAAEPPNLGLPDGMANTKRHSQKPMAPKETAARIQVPAGFHVSLFAGEPDLCQPIDFDIDDRGRLWAVECFSYPENEGPPRDRVVMFTDRDGDGVSDERKVFLANGRRLTSVAVGFGGVWVLSLPELLFYPDRDGDGVADGPPEVVLDGWSLVSVHNMVNGLAWGPDGWLYGRHGMHAVSRVGRPGTPDAARIPLDCGIWRYHPVRREFEVVVRGMVNPWGLDWDENGQSFIGNNVNGHLWHLIPGALYERTAGAGFDPYSYGTIPICADHLHFGGASWREGWIASRSATGEHDTRGGGHSHCGAMVYLGDNWPDEYRGTIFQCNTHGRRVNNDALARRGSGYVATHRPDFMRVNDPWFRGTAIRYGPDGGVYVSDWNDLGECHDHDGTYRSSGRIYKIVHGTPARTGSMDLARLSDPELVALLGHRNEWYSRHARRLLQERASASAALPATRAAVRSLFGRDQPGRLRLRALWTLHGMGDDDEALLLGALQDPGEHVRWWAVQFLCENRYPSMSTVEAMARLASDGASSLTRLALASALQRMPVADRWPIAEALVRHAGDARDPNLPWMIWYGLQASVASDPARAFQMLKPCQIPLIHECIGRRLVSVALEEPERSGAILGSFAGVLMASQDPIRLGVLKGMRTGLEGQVSVSAPALWNRAYGELRSSGDPAIRDLARAVALVLGCPVALDDMRLVVSQPDAAVESRRAAIQALATRRDAVSLDPLFKLLASDGPLRLDVLKALSGWDDDRIPARVLEAWPQLDDVARQTAFGTLLSRQRSAAALLEAVDAGRVSRSEISAPNARLIHGFKNARFDAWLEANWGRVRGSAGSVQAEIEHYRRLLTPGAILKADAKLGREVFLKTCGVCHRLFGQGTQIGPDLAGHFTDVESLLQNIVDPNAVVPKDFQQVTITTKDDELLSGLVVGEDGVSVKLRTLSGEVVIPRARIQAREAGGNSMMPEGLLRTLDDDSVRNLFLYLRREKDL